MLLTLVRTRGTAVSVTRVRAPKTVCLPLGGPRVSLRRLGATCSALVRRDHATVTDTRRTVGSCLSRPRHSVLGVRGVPRVLHRITNTMHFLRLPAPTDVLDRLTGCVRRHVRDKRHVSSDALTCVTSIVVTISRRLSNFRRGHPIDGRTLSINRRDLDRLLTTWR